MKIDFKTIKKLTGSPRYKADTPLKYLSDKIADWTENLGLDLDVDFQRGHVWTEDQQVKFVEFIIRGGKTTPFLFNHPNWMGSFKGEFVVVDGKQRLTALLKFLNGELKVFGGFIDEFENLQLNTFDISFWINDLKTRKEVLQWYLELNSAGTPHTKDELDKVKNILKKI